MERQHMTATLLWDGGVAAIGRQRAVAISAHRNRAIKPQWVKLKMGAFLADLPLCKTR